MERALYRPLMVYAFDPTQGRNLGNQMTVHLLDEELAPGPIGRLVEVIDYDATNDCYYRPAELDDRNVLLQGGLRPSESDPRFHQQMVYAVASETIKQFELALGRNVTWGFRSAEKGAGHVRRLRIFPHAMEEANAFYSRKARGLLFGYFRAGDDPMTANLPGQTVFTCLSHDIVAHETTHALVDGQRRYFMEPTGPDTLAFHEAFADIIALLQHFSFQEALAETIRRTGGRLHQLSVKPEVAPGPDGPLLQSELGASNPMVDLARQFGEAMGRRAALRSALGTPPNRFLLDQLFEPHDRGAILVAAVFDAFFTSFLRKTADLFRIARSGGAALAPGDLHPDLAARLASEAAKTAKHFGTMCIRALDYCAPVDITFGDFLRALVTSDADLVPDDRYEYRPALIEAFRLRGIRPTRVVSLSEDSLKWEPARFAAGKAPVCDGLVFGLVGPPDPKAQKENAKRLSRFGSENAAALGLDPDRPVQAHSFHAVHRVGPDGARYGFVAELLQRRPAGAFTFRGGVTLVLDADGKVRYGIYKHLANEDRLEAQRAYYARFGAQIAESTYLVKARSQFDADTGGPARSMERRFDFASIHRGY